MSNFIYTKLININSTSCSFKSELTSELDKLVYGDRELCDEEYHYLVLEETAYSGKLGFSIRNGIMPIGVVGCVDIDNATGEITKIVFDEYAKRHHLIYGTLPLQLSMNDKFIGKQFDMCRLTHMWLNKPIM